MENLRPELEEQKAKLHDLRNKMGLRRSELAEYFGIPIRTLEDWEAGKRKMPEYLLRLMFYKAAMEKICVGNVKTDVLGNDRKINIIRDEKENSIVIIHDIRFKGRQNINWQEVENYIKEYVGNCYEIIDTADKIYIGPDFPGELKGSNDTTRLKGAGAKAKANATQEIPLLLEYAGNKRWSENWKDKHGADAQYGWYRYTSRFALPVYSETGEVERYNIFRIEMLVRHASDGKLYLYDMVNVKKENEVPRLG